MEGAGWGGLEVLYNILGFDKGRGGDRCRGDIRSFLLDNFCGVDVFVFRVRRLGGCIRL